MVKENSEVSAAGICDVTHGREVQSLSVLLPHPLLPLQ